MKQTKKTKLPLASETVRSLSLRDDQLEAVAGGTYTYSVINSKCADSTLCNG